MKTRILTLIVSLFIATIAFAYEAEIDGIYYDFDYENKTAMVTHDGDVWGNDAAGYTQSEIIIPEKVNYNGVEYNVTSIGDYAFAGCSLTSITIGNSVTSIGDCAFNGCSLTSITIPNSVTSIGEGAFAYCSFLASITIPNSVTSIGRSAFEECSSLATVNIIAKSVEDYCKKSVVNNFPTSCQRHLIIDEEEIKNLVIPEGVDVINSSIFCNFSSLESVIIPNNVTSIGDYAFYNCSSLTSVQWNAKKCSDFHDNSYLFGGHEQITSFTFGDNVEYIPAYLCDGISKLTSITIPNSVTSIGVGAFRGCSSLTSVTIPNSVTSIRWNAFYSCSSLTSITIPNSVTSIGDYAFYDCSSLTSITIPNSVTSIGWSAFYGCSSLTSIEIPNSVIYLESEVFANCSSLDTLICEFGDDVELDFDEYSGDETGHPLVGTKNLRYFQGPAKLVNTITEEFQTQFSNKLTEVHITDGELDENGFNYINRSKKSLHTIDLAGTTNTAINDLAFYDCYKLENLMLPDNLETIGFKAVAECYQLKEINIPASVVEINDAAFENCRSIKSITFGGQAEAKSFASRMKRAAADGDVALQRIGNWAFYNCHALENLVIPEGVTEVGDAAFYGCTYLDSLALPSTTQRIGDNCFALCSRMKQINVNAIEPPTIFAKTFFDVNRNIPVIVPEGARDAYANDEYWGEFINVVESDDVDTSIENAENANVAIYSVGGVLYVDGLSADYQVFDVNGRLVYTGRDVQLTLPRGVYVIAVGGEMEKIVL